MDKCNLNFKKYIGTKVVEARPMNEIDAESIGYARENSDNHEWRDGYHIRFTHSDGSFHDSWSPKDVFEKVYCEVKGITFEEVIEALKTGFAVRHKGWNGKGLFVVKQVPAHIEGDIIPKMQSLPQSAKDILMSRENPHKSEPKYRPFKDKEECWAEMLRHSPFGWFKDKKDDEFFALECISSKETYEYLFKDCIFMDGSICGVKVEK